MPESEIIAVYIFLGCIGLVYGLELINLFKRIVTKLRGKPWKESWKERVLHILSVLGLLSFAYGYFIEPNWIEITTVNIHTNKLDQTSLKIVQISDVHSDKKLRNERKVVEVINSLNPDIIVFTGDTLNTPEALDNFKEMMSKLHAKLDKFAVRGNFDIWYWSNIDLFGNTGFKVLDQDVIRLTKNNEQFVVAGLSSEYPSRYKEVLKNIPEDTFNIFLHHYPGLIEDIRELNIDLYLAGHTHGGQVALPFYGALITLSKHGKKYESGKYSVGETILYVNRGIGMEGGMAPRVRFWARPEITIFNILAEKKG